MAVEVALDEGCFGAMGDTSGVSSNVSSSRLTSAAKVIRFEVGTVPLLLPNLTAEAAEERAASTLTSPSDTFLGATNDSGGGCVAAGADADNPNPEGFFGATKGIGGIAADLGAIDGMGGGKAAAASTLVEDATPLLLTGATVSTFFGAVNGTGG